MFFGFLCIFVAGLALSFLFNLLLEQFSLKHNILKIKGIPHIGGLAIALSFFIFCLLAMFCPKVSAHQITALLLPAMIMLIFGIIDDKKELSVWGKFFVQAIAVLLLIVMGIRTKIILFNSAINIVVTFIWVIGIANAFNHLDIMDGLAGSTGLIISLAFFAIALSGNDLIGAVFCLALAGSIAGFLIRNFPPAKIYLGNSGSHFLGFILAAAAISLSYAPADGKIALLSPIIILGLPIFDTAFVVIVRLCKGRSALLKSNDHLALRFLRLGFSKKTVLFFMCALAFSYALCAVVISRISQSVGLIILGILFLASLIVGLRMGKVAVDG